MNILDLITASAKNKEITAYQVIEAFNKGSGGKYRVDNGEKGLNLTNIIGTIGGLFIFLGSGFYLSFFWDNFNNFTKLIVSLGIGLVLFYFTLFLNTIKANSFISNLMIPISFIWLNWGTYHTLMQSNYSTDIKEWLYVLTLGITAIVYLLSYIYYKKSLFFTGFNILYVATLFGFLDKILKLLKLDTNSNQFYISAIVIGISGLLIHYNYYKLLNPFVRGLNLSGFYGITMSAIVAILGFWNSNNEKLPSPIAILELITSFLFIGWYLIAIKAQSKLLIVINSIGLYFWLTYIYSKFFNSYDFGITLIVAGLLLMFISYFTWQLNSKIKNTDLN